MWKSVFGGVGEGERWGERCGEVLGKVWERGIGGRWGICVEKCRERREKITWVGVHRASPHTFPHLLPPHTPTPPTTLPHLPRCTFPHLFSPPPHPTHFSTPPPTLPSHLSTRPPPHFLKIVYCLQYTTVTPMVAALNYGQLWWHGASFTVNNSAWTLNGITLPFIDDRDRLYRYRAQCHVNQP